MPPELLKLLATALQPQPAPAGPDFAALLSQLQNPDPVANSNRLSGLPSYAAGSQSPFNTDFFNNTAASLSPEARLASQGPTAQNQWAALGATAGVDPTKLAEFMRQRDAGIAQTQQTNPSARFPVGTVVPEPPQPSMGFDPTTREAAPGVFEGLINKSAPDATKFSDANVFSAQPGVSHLPPGAVVGDGRTNYRRRRDVINFPKPSFNFR